MPLSLKQSFNESTMYGVAALFCRLGLRPHCSSEIASRTVADFMGVLSYVSFTNSSYIAGYPSEPPLAFGATRLWYQIDSTSLEKCILPYFHQMLMQRVVDTSDIGEIVTRIFLLLAMDATTLRLYNKNGEQKKEDFIFAGQFCSVRAFLAMLSGSIPELRSFDVDEITTEQEEDNNAWLKNWEGWNVSLVQFVDLPNEPTEKTLWLLLGRRAAGVLRRNQKGSDLVIPIFSGKKISFILVRVKNQIKDKHFQEAATSKLLPENVFKDKNPLSKVEPRNMIIVYMGLREESTNASAQMCVDTTTTRSNSAEMKETPSTKEPMKKKVKKLLKMKPFEQYTDAVGAGEAVDFTAEVDKNVEAPTPKKTSCVFYLRGICEQDRRDTTATPRVSCPFLSYNVSKCLESIAKSSWWNVQELVATDLKTCNSSAFADQLNVLTEDEVLETVEHSVTIGAKRKFCQP